MDKAVARELAEWIRQKISAARASTSSAPALAAEDPLVQLRQLAELHKAGVLTDEEFAAKKKQLLGI